ncbi:MAG: FecR domain-containing protein, partial [Deltaproteobacteria bacterium]|nr:FecR domain-containing protein [Deltaproteobacteria bacterium]
MRRALLAAMIATAVAGIPVRPAHADGETVALAVEGRVTVVRAGVGDIALAPGIVIESGDHLVSDDAGRALIRSSDNALVSIGPYTQAMFDDGEGDGRNPIVTILSGDARILLRETDSQSGTVIATKSAAIRARDAYFLVRHERGDERTRVLALSGSIDVARAGDERVGEHPGVVDRGR